MSIFNIAGRIFSGDNITIRNDKVIIDGKEQDGKVSGVVEIRVVEGVINRLETDASVSCNNVEGGVRAGGSVTCDQVSGDVTASGSVTCDAVGGSVYAGGSVTCDDVGGNVKADGSVRANSVRQAP